MRKFLFCLPIFAMLSCGGVPDTAARRYIEQNIKEGTVNFISATDIDSTKHITPDALNKMRLDFAKNGNLKCNFNKSTPKTLFYTRIKYTVTHTNGSVDTLYQTIYTDEEQSIVYAIK